MYHHPVELGKSILIMGSDVTQHYEYHVCILFTAPCFGWLIQPSSSSLTNWFLLWIYTTGWWRLYKSSETCCSNYNEYMIFMGRNSSVSIATVYWLDGPGINSWWGDFPHLSRPALGTHPASYRMGTGSFLGVKKPGHGIDHPPPCSTEVKERVELYLYTPFGPSWPVLGWTLYDIHNVVLLAPCHW